MRFRIFFQAREAKRVTDAQSAPPRAGGSAYSPSSFGIGADPGHQEQSQSEKLRLEARGAVSLQLGGAGLDVEPSCPNPHGPPLSARSRATQSGKPPILTHSSRPRRRS
jgi:hypothetical protein